MMGLYQPFPILACDDSASPPPLVDSSSGEEAARGVVDGDGSASEASSDEGALVMLGTITGFDGIVA